MRDCRPMMRRESMYQGASRNVRNCEEGLYARAVRDPATRYEARGHTGMRPPPGEAGTVSSRPGTANRASPAITTSPATRSTNWTMVHQVIPIVWAKGGKGTNMWARPSPQLTPCLGYLPMARIFGDARTTSGTTTTAAATSDHAMPLARPRASCQSQLRARPTRAASRGAARSASSEKTALGWAPIRPRAPTIRNTACPALRASALAGGRERQSSEKRRPTRTASPMRPGSSAVPVALGHWLYMVSASAGILGMRPATTGAARIAVREEVSTDTRAAAPVTHTAMRTREETFEAGTTVCGVAKSATNACHPVG